MNKNWVKYTPLPKTILWDGSMASFIEIGLVPLSLKKKKKKTKFCIQYTFKIKNKHIRYKNVN